MLNKIKFGVVLPPWNIDYGTVKAFALDCEELGYHSVWIPDHLIWGNSILECWTTLSALAAATSHIRLGAIVTCNLFRNPSLLAKMAATVDVISNGRLEFGIGAGYKEDEYEAYYGMSLPRASMRIERLKEAVEIIKEMWTKERPRYEGKYYRIKDAVCKPDPVQKPHPPITIGGGGEKLTLRLVAKYANRFNLSGPWDIEVFKRKLRVLRRHCSEVNRRYEEIEKSKVLRILVYPRRTELKKIKVAQVERPNIVGTPNECTEKIREYIDVGARCFMMLFVDFPSRKGLKLFAEQVVPNVNSKQ